MQPNSLMIFLTGGKGDYALFLLCETFVIILQKRAVKIGIFQSFSSQLPRSKGISTSGS